MARSPLLFLPIAGTALLGAACPLFPTALQLVLTPNPELNAVGDLLGQVERVQVIVEAPAAGGWQDLSGEDGDGERADWDGDGENEVSFVSPAIAGSALPVLEIGVGRYAGQALELRVYGLPKEAAADPDQAVALGGASATCASGQVQRVAVPFNLKAAARPPRVAEVFPFAGATNIPYNLYAVTVVFSTALDHQTVPGAILLSDSQASPVAFHAELRDIDLAIGDAAAEPRTVAELILDQVLDFSYADLRVEPGPVSRAGLGFDQVPEEPGAQPFLSRFGIAAELQGGCPEGYRFDPQNAACVAEMGCASSCTAGYVCDAEAQRCVEDCRLYRVCADPQLSCSDESGLCG
ncbi:MAG: hypothetical protein JXR83_03530 [Deltaproteobacteria bacterium]|nr:hypothetical protein [Deltaproteobacteria bacterium]